MARYRLSKRLGVLVDHFDFLDALGSDTTSARGEIHRCLAVMAMLDALAAANNTGEMPCV